MMTVMKNESADWPQRSWALTIAGAVVGLLIYFLSEDGTTKDVWRLALATGLVVAGVALAFVVERERIVPSAIFSGLAALIIGFAFYWNGGPDGWSEWEGWRFACAVLTVAIAAPFFQAWGDAGALRPPRLAQLSYPDLHDRAWANVVLWFACWLFVGICWLLILLIGQLFSLIGIDAIEDLIRESWFAMIVSGAAFGAAAGQMRDRERILMTLQTVVRRVLSVLAPILGAALLLFLASMLVTGLSPLWDATKSTTPLLISVVIVAIILANAAIGDSTGDEAKMPIIRWGTVALGGVVLPLGIIAAISTGLRIDQYGLTPDRLWASVFGGIACAYGLAYLLVLIIRRGAWMGGIRRANVRLALGLCGLALLLATPLVNFGAWSTQSQLARLEAGKVTPDKFDWPAMRFDFGPTGQAAVERLAKSGNTQAIKDAAAKALTLEDRWSGGNEIQGATKAEQFQERIKILPVAVPIPDALAAAVVRNNGCEDAVQCALLYNAGASEAIQIIQPCDACDIFTNRYVLRDGVWQTGTILSGDETPNSDAEWRARAKALAQEKISIREVKRRQVFVGDEPVGDIFE